MSEADGAAVAGVRSHRPRSWKGRDASWNIRVRRAQADHALLIECASAETRRLDVSRPRSAGRDWGAGPARMDATLAQRRLECDAAVSRLR